MYMYMCIVVLTSFNEGISVNKRLETIDNSLPKSI